ncbi:MAG: DUF2281 domain-containing protein, partial [Alkalinema sp. RU_4_3]|nr:DUF2281 domain-containing protein [Alkalinema sp. RU_4_3]
EILHYAEYLATKHPPTNQSKTSPQKYRQAGSLQGKIILAADFDAPLEDLKDYM